MVWGWRLPGITDNRYTSQELPTRFSSRLPVARNLLPIMAAAAAYIFNSHPGRKSLGCRLQTVFHANANGGPPCVIGRAGQGELIAQYEC